MAGARYDLVVVGAGTAGLPAAIAAAERGLRVALVEAADRPGGTLPWSSASISAAGTSIQRAHGVEDSAERHYRDCLRLNGGTGDLTLLRRWTCDAAETVEWLLSIGWTCTPDAPVFAPEHDLYDTPRTYRSSRQGLSLLDAFTPPIERARGEGLLELFSATRLHSLDMTGGRATGIVAGRDGQDLRIDGAAVALTTGGYGGSERHWRDLHGLTPLRYHCPTARGDGLDAAVGAGAAARFAEHVLPAFGATRDLGSAAAAWINTVTHPGTRPPWEIYVNAHGRRFMREDETGMDARERALMAQPGWSFWAIYDRDVRDTAPPLFRRDEADVERLFATDPDHVAADTLDELAERCGLPAAALRDTVADYSRGQGMGEDAWGRTHLPAPIAAPPFYAVKHHGVSICAPAGLAVDETFNVLRPDGSAIPGLYAAGEQLGAGFLGRSFLSGSIVSAAITFGRWLGHEVPA